MSPTLMIQIIIGKKSKHFKTAEIVLMIDEFFNDGCLILAHEI
jgi:hypothetical protein